MFGISLNSFGNALLRPNLTGLISRNVSPHHQGLALGFAQTLMSVAQIVCPLISGFLIEKEWYFIFTSSISMASVLGLLSTLRIRQPKISLS
jgi:fucose permease